MNWKTENNLKRIYNVFKRSKSQIYKEDIEALESVLNQIKQAKKQTSIDNILFVKLLSIHLYQNIEFYGSINQAVKETGKQLANPLNEHIEMLRLKINTFVLDSYLETLTESDFKDKVLIDKINKSFEFSQVENSLYNSANDFITDINNYS